MRTQKLSTVEEIEMEPPSVAVSKEKHDSESLVEEEYNDEDGDCVEGVHLKDDISDEPLDQKFNCYNPFSWFSWFKWRYPIYAFTFLMILETLDYASDVAQLIEVSGKFYRYSKSPPYESTGASGLNDYTVYWNRVEDQSTGESLLGYRLEWEGNPSGTRDKNLVGYVSSNPQEEKERNRLNFDNGVFELDCLYDTNRYETKQWQTSIKNYSASSIYTYEEGVCISLGDVFNLAFPKPFWFWDDVYSFGTSGGTKLQSPTAYCPNNSTGVFDANSFKITNAAVTLCEVYETCQTNVTTEAINMLSHYRPEWTKKTFTLYQCDVLVSFYHATLTFFIIQSICIFFQALQMLQTLRKGESVSRRTRVQYTVEMPLIGFLIAPCLLSKADWDIYAVIESESSKPHPGAFPCLYFYSFSSLPRPFY